MLAFLAPHSLHAVMDAALSLSRPFYVEHFVFLSVQVVIVDEELFELAHEFLS